MSKAAIPAVTVASPALRGTLEALRHNVNKVTGQGNNSVELNKLRSDASYQDVIDTLNAVIDRLECE